MSDEPVFHEGDRAILRSGGEDVEVEVIEERGPIGVGGRRLVRIRLQRAFASPVEFEIPEVELRPVTDAA